MEGGGDPPEKKEKETTEKVEGGSDPPEKKETTQKMEGGSDPEPEEKDDPPEKEKETAQKMEGERDQEEEEETTEKVEEESDPKEEKDPEKETSPHSPSELLADVKLSAQEGEAEEEGTSSPSPSKKEESEEKGKKIEPDEREPGLGDSLGLVPLSRKFDCVQVGGSSSHQPRSLEVIGEQAPVTIYKGKEISKLEELASPEESDSDSDSDQHGKLHPLEITCDAPRRWRPPEEGWLSVDHKQVGSSSSHQPQSLEVIGEQAPVTIYKGKEISKLEELASPEESDSDSDSDQHGKLHPLEITCDAPRRWRPPEEGWLSVDHKQVGSSSSHQPQSLEVIGEQAPVMIYKGKEISKLEELASTEESDSDSDSDQHGRLPSLKIACDAPRRWRPPEDGWLKMNVEGLRSEHMIAMGAVVRDSNGGFLSAVCDSYHVEKHIVITKAIALRNALIWADGGLLDEKIVVEMTSEIVVHHLTDFEAVRSLSPDDELRSVLVECIRLASHFQDLEIVYVSEEENRLAHCLANAALRQVCEGTWDLLHAPEWLQEAAFADLPD